MVLGLIAKHKRVFFVDLPALALIFLVPPLLVPESKAIIISYLILLTVLSRSTLLYDSMRIEFHCMIIIAISYVFGAQIGIFTTFVGMPLVYRLGPWLRAIPHPLFHTIDLFFLSLVSVVASLAPTPAAAFTYGMVAIIIGDHVLVNIIRVITLPEPLTKRFIMSAMNIGVNYMLMTNFLLPLIVYLS